MARAFALRLRPVQLLVVRFRRNLTQRSIALGTIRRLPLRLDATPPNQQGKSRTVVQS